MRLVKRRWGKRYFAIITTLILLYISYFVNSQKKTERTYKKFLISLLCFMLYIAISVIREARRFLF